MPHDALTWDLAAVPVVIVLGTLWHFCFDWSGRRRALAVFFPVNESVWEHLKMAYWPLLLFTGAQFAVGAGSAALAAGRALGFFAMCAVLLGLYYATAALAPEVGVEVRLVIDGIIFVAAVAVGQAVCHFLLALLRDVPSSAGAVLLASPAAVFAVTTFALPRVALFEDQLTGGYGIARRR